MSTNDPNYQDIEEHLGPLSAAERFVAESSEPAHSGPGRSVLDTYRIIYQSRETERIVKMLISSNEQLSASTDRNARALNRLTAVLVMIAVLTFIVQYTPLGDPALWQDLWDRALYFLSGP